MEMAERFRLAMLMSGEMLRRTICAEDMEFLHSFAEIVNPLPPETVEPGYMRAQLAEAEACFTCWGTPALDESILAAAPKLRLILHGAGTPKAIVCAKCGAGVSGWPPRRPS